MIATRRRRDCPRVRAFPRFALTSPVLSGRSLHHYPPLYYLPTIQFLRFALRRILLEYKMAESRRIRNPSHAGSWYTANRLQLSSQLDGWLDAVKTPVSCIGPHSEGESANELPVSKARMIIATWVYSNRQSLGD